MDKTIKDPHQNQTTTIYNQNAARYKQSTQDFTFPPDILEIFLSLLPRKKILDVGCAYGRDVHRLRNDGYEATGIDISSELIDLANPNTKEYLKCGDMLDLEEKITEKQHGMIFSGSIVHMNKDCGIHVLSQSYNLLHDGGVLFLSVKLIKPHTSEIGSVSIPGTERKFVYYTEQEIGQTLENIGFTIEKTYNNKSSIVVGGKKGDDVWYTLLCKK